MYTIYDVTDWRRITTEQMGTKRKFWCRHPGGHLCLFKFSRSHAGENWSEKIAAEVASVMGIPHADIDLAKCREEDGDHHGTISRDFTVEKSYGSLIHGNELLLEQDPNYPLQGPNFRVAQHTLERILGVLSQPYTGISAGLAVPADVLSASDIFVGYLLLDALIANTDRHHENWGILMRPPIDGRRRAELAPTFDHASSLGRELTDIRRSDKLRAETMRTNPQRPSGREQTIVGYLEKEEARSRIFLSETDTKALQPMELFQKAFERLPQAGESWVQRLSSVGMPAIENIVANVPQHTMSLPARDFCLRLMKLTYTALITRTFRYV